MINELITLAKKYNIEIEVFTESCNQYCVDTLNTEVESFNINKETNYQIKAIYNDKMVILDYDNISNPEEIIKTIINNVNLVDNDNKNKLCDNDYICDDKEVVIPDMNYIKNEFLKLIEYKNKYPFIQNIYSYFSFADNKLLIDNDKHHMYDRYNLWFTYIDISGSKGDITKNVSFSIYDNKFDIKRLKEELENKIKELELSFDATSIETNKYKVLLTNEVSGEIINSFGSAFYEKALEMNLSPFSNKLGEKIVSEKITLVEEPTNDKFIVNKHFDSEGVLTYNKTIIDKGVFKTALNTLEYAIKNNTKPTGNALGTINLHLEEGTKSYNELVNMLDNGIIINTIQGMHAGVNYQTGDMSLQAAGFKVENGKIVKALDMIILQTNIFELLTNVIEVGNDMKEFNTSISSVSLLLDDITVSGNL